MLDIESFTNEFWTQNDWDGLKETVTYLDGTVEAPRLEKGDKSCETLLLNQIKNMPRLNKPLYKGTIGEYRFYFTKD